MPPASPRLDRPRVGRRELLQEPALVRGLRRTNAALGVIEVAALALFVLALILAAVYQVVATKWTKTETVWSFELIRDSVFLIAMTAAALAAQSDQMISMDVITRIVGKNAKAALRILTRLFTIAVTVLLAVGAERTRQLAGGDTYELIDPALVSLALPAGASLIVVHLVIHLAIDTVHLVRGWLVACDDEASPS